jgi:hypothetical protein
MASDRVNTPKAVPRRSLPAITRALSTPGSGWFTVAKMNDSHCPSMALTSSFPSRINVSISALFPMVPINTACEESSSVTL